MAIVDGGFDLFHQEFIGANLLPGIDVLDGDADVDDLGNGLDDDDDGTPDEGVGHGNAVLAAIQPIVLRCDPPAFTRSGRWYQQPPYGFRMTIEAKPLLGAATLLAGEQAAGFKPRALTRALERFFTTELEGYERASA